MQQVNLSEILDEENCFVDESYIFKCNELMKDFLSKRNIKVANLGDKLSAS